MTIPPRNGCLSCSHAEWQLTATGRISQRASGKCGAPLPDLMKILPASVEPPRIWKRKIWPDMGHDCPTWQPKEAASK